MLLAVDVGNTNLKVGVHDGDRWLDQWRLQTVVEKTVDEYWVSLSVDASVDCGIVVQTERPNEVGADRITNAVAAVDLYGGPAIVIDMGTATTFDVVSANRELIGVVISPGLRLAADALTSRAAQLSRVPLNAPAQVLGRNTVQSVQSGIVYGYAGLVEGVVQRLITELQFEPTVIGTGGLIEVIAAHTDVIDVIEPALTLHGLRLIAARQATANQLENSGA